MIKSFADRRTQELYVTGTAKRFPSDVASRDLELTAVAATACDINRDLRPGTGLHGQFACQVVDRHTVASDGPPLGLPLGFREGGIGDQRRKDERGEAHHVEIESHSAGVRREETYMGQRARPVGLTEADVQPNSSNGAKYPRPPNA